MKTILLSLLIFLTAASQAETLRCAVRLRLENYSEKIVTIQPNSSLQFEDVEGFRFKLNNQGNSKFELEIFDGTNQTRNYASASLKSESDNLDWSFWSRDNLIDCNCQLNTKKISQ